MEQPYLAIYDITDAKRLNKVANILQDYGVRIQKSVFELWLSTTSRQIMEKRLRAVMDEQKDGIKLFPLCEACMDKKAAWGTFPAGKRPPPGSFSSLRYQSLPETSPPAGDDALFAYQICCPSREPCVTKGRIVYYTEIIYK